MHTTKRTKGIQLNMRVYAGDKEKIGAFKDSLGLSPRDLFFFLMDYYEKNHQRNEEISLPMYRNDNCSKSLSRDSIQKIVFPGEIVYLSDRIYSFAITPEVARAIEMQYKYKINSDWIYDAEALKKADEEFWGKGCIYAPYEPDYGDHNAAFWFDHSLDVYFHDKEKKYLVHEKAVIRQNPRAACNLTEPVYEPLNLQRCKFVKDYGEICRYFSKCADPRNLKQIRLAMAEDIGTDYTQLEKFF